MPPRRPAPPTNSPDNIHDAMLNDGDYVVHTGHGVTRYRGVTTLKTPVTQAGAPATERDYLILEYRDNDRLYVSADQIDRVHRSLSADSEGVTAPALDKLRGSAWARSLARARRQAEQAAAGMVSLYVARAAATGHVFPADTPEQQRMEAAFRFTETPDQAKAIAYDKRDLEAPRHMDRLLVGDVGYGKTEVVVRVAFKAALSGRQAAILCPTSVLAAEHFQTLVSRSENRVA